MSIDFHPRFKGLTGSLEAVSKLAKSYGIYISRPPIVDIDDDYIIDHSVYYFLLDPNGKFVKVFNRDVTAKEAAKDIKNIIKKFKSWGLFKCEFFIGP